VSKPADSPGLITVYEEDEGEAYDESEIDQKTATTSIATPACCLQRV
jgi:hypothetical protein